MDGGILIVAGMIIVGIIFFMVIRTFIFSEEESIVEAKVRANAEEIVSLIERISKDPAKNIRYTINITLSNISISNNILTYESFGYKFNYLLTSNVSNVNLKEIASLCIVKKDGQIQILEECPTCNLDLVCDIEECKQECDDCRGLFGPPPICIGDNYCNLYIGENCGNSNDCGCRNFGNDFICCPGYKKSNSHGCTNVINLDEGEECGCDAQCKPGLKCNPTTEDFKDYERACCPEGKRWNGKECEMTEVFDIFIVPVQVSENDKDAYISAALSFKSHFLSVSPFSECKNKEQLVKVWIIDISDCPEEAASRCYDHCSDCINIGRRCARKMEDKLGVNYDKFQVLTRGGGRFYHGCACDTPCDGGSNLLLGCSFNLCIPSHEIGHDLGLGHVDCGVRCDACKYRNPNCPDCGLPLSEKIKFIMDYCNPMERYGPAAYNFLANDFIGTPPNAAGLGKWMQACVR